jgi:hypothetical protein
MEQSQQQVYWNPDAQINISGAEFGAFSQILDLVLSPMGSYSLGDMMTLVAMAQEARGQILKRLQETNQIFNAPVSPSVDSPVMQESLKEEPIESPTVSKLGGDYDVDKVIEEAPDYAEAVAEFGEISITEESSESSDTPEPPTYLGDIPEHESPTLTEIVQEANLHNKIDENEEGFLI